MWWYDDTIEQAVTKEFVCSRLVPEEIQRLDQPLEFGGTLTDCTYWEWIDEKAKRLFLIVADLGLPDQIFGLIDDSLDDGDLPIALDQVERLFLTSGKDEKTERKFYQRQFHYLLRPLQAGGHTDYDDDEVVPLDVVDKKHALGQHIDKVTLPDDPGTVLCRCRIPLGPGHLSWEEFISEVNGIKDMQNEHLLSYSTSYTHQGYGYILFTPAPEYTLKSLLASTPSCLKNVDKKVRPQLVMNWIHCLVDTLCFLHNGGLLHGNIRPSTVMFSSDNHIFFTGFTRFHACLLGSVADHTSFDKEAYDHAAPEKLFKPVSTSPTSRSAELSHSPTNMHASASSPQAADIFSLGCLILELLSFLFKKHGKPFAAHRAAKHKSAGRGGAVPDSSFHKNLGQVDSWMKHLAKDAAKKKDEPVFRGVAPLLSVVEHMLAFYPSERPSASEVRARVYQILAESCGIPEPHCPRLDSGLDYAFGSLTLSRSTLASGGSTDSISSAMSGSLRRLTSLAREAEMDRALPRSRNDSHDSQMATQRFFAEDRSNKWQTSLYQSQYGSALHAL
ncbi:hypothetical protein N658DRAFT_567061 [Parathielavia hyrcaniae]|uniref:Protein kinase domain-containing protein n=1 Tax=Parathielavia hyrcaniae TaxID=113614 RepID=A0AAN6T1X7_9PEZI|nr:hypothetical protein N658DRAFT_567061 [Parathielavia hyrcaniae]